MTRWIWLLSVVVLILAAFPLWAADPTPQQPTQPATSSSNDLQNAYNKGNYKVAYDGLSKLLLSGEKYENLDRDYGLCLGALRNLGRVEEVDAFRQKAIAAHAGDWHFLWTAAASFRNEEHYGAIVAGNFERGGRRAGDGKWVGTLERDRVRALQLMVEAMNLLQKEQNPAARKTDDAGRFYEELANILIMGSNGADAWRLQYLTDLKQLPDYEEGRPFYYGRRGGWGGYYGMSRGAPVDEKGAPIYHKLPKSWDAAATDGERWRWALMQMGETSKYFTAKAQWEWAKFLNSQFGVQTMAQYGALFRGKDEDGKKDESGPFAVYTLKDDETIAKLATGIKRFNIPDEYNAIKVLQTLAGDEQANLFDGIESAESFLATIYQDRQQYDTAADWLNKGIARHPNRDDYNTRLDQIEGNWGMFDNSQVQPAGDVGAKLEFRFRNATRVHFSAHEIDIAKLLEDVKDYIRTKPNQLDWQQLEINNLGYRLVEKNQQKYLLKETAAWDLELKPRPGHFDRRITVETPLKKAGAYLLEGTLENGNISRIIVWVSDTVIVRKRLSDATYTYVADAVTGQPVAGAKVEFFGYKQEWQQNGRNYKLTVAEHAAETDADGQVLATADQLPANFNWITTATTKDGKLAYTGFSGVWYGRYYDAYDQQYNRTKAFFITDRPVYRPEQNVQWKVWVGENKYDVDGKSKFAGQTVTVEIWGPRGDKQQSISGTLDEWGGLSGEWTIDKSATLGVYSIHMPNGWGGTSFRVEEYKKPEFEVKVDAPTEPVALGETVTAKIAANYYFGAPVVNARVKYKVTRTSYHAQWYPAGRWDWFYEPGYWWFAPDYWWYPGFGKWGCLRPIHPWWPGYWGNEQPEIVTEGEVPIGPDGTYKVEIDTAIAKAAYGDEDHKYEITAEVTDASRRTIVGSGEVLVARQPFKVYAWVDRGYYHVGDQINAHFQAQTLDRKPVKGTGLLKLFFVKYDEKAQPVETEVGRWKLDTNDQGTATQQIKAKEPGQYRLSYAVTDAKGREIEGGYVFVIRGEGFDGKDFRFNDVEVTTDKKEYAAGDKVKLQVNANRADATVLLFVRPSNGIYLPPKVIRLKGKSTIEEIAVGRKDMPNFFVEALTVSNAKIFTDVREVIVPPEDRVLNVSVTSDAPEYKPGTKAKLTLKVTEKNGEPFTGAAVLSLYDKAVEYISGGSNVADIRKYFWQWRRQHYVQTESSLSKMSTNITRSHETPMSFLGVFGALATQYGEFAKDQKAKDDSGFRASGAVSWGRMASNAEPAPPAAGPAMLKGEMQLQAAGAREMEDADKAGGQPRGAAEIEPTVRSNFADTAYWAPRLVTAKDGTATVEVEMPENLTTWKAKVWTLGAGTRVGQAETEVVTKKNLIVRLEAPRFFVETDEVVLSAIVHNYLKTKKNVRVELELEGATLQPTRERIDPVDPNRIQLTPQLITVEANGEQRVDWRVTAVREGTALVRMKAITDEESDATQQSFPVYVHGMLKMESFSGAIRDKVNSQTVTLKVPAERRPEASRLEVRYSPTLAGAMVDALPYLVDYPYGCTEQTLNRFVPTVITQKILLDMKLDLAAIEKKRTNLNAQEIGKDEERAKDWGHKGQKGTQRFGMMRPDYANPVFDKDEVTRMVRAGVANLSNMQLSDGGWGWFSGYGEHSSPHTTAVVVHGLQVARANGAAVDANVIARGVEWLKKYQAHQIQMLKDYDQHKGDKQWQGEWKEHADEIDAFVFMVLIDADVADATMKDYLFRDRTKIAVYAKAMYGLALVKIKDADKLKTVLENIQQFVVQDDENQTAYLKLPADGWWWWYNSEYEAQAYYLKLLAATDPKGQTASRLAKYLVNNRKHATYWNSTRDTAICIEALADYMRASGEDAPDMTVRVALDGKQVKEVKITAADLFAFDNKFVLEGRAITDGEHKLEISRDGKGPLYFNAYLTNFTLEKHITHAGLEIKINRKVYLLTRADKTGKAEGSHGQVVNQKVEKYVRTELADGATVKSGDLVEVELEVDSKNDYEYIILEDMKPAGFEAVEVRSGYNGNDMHAYAEFRDERAAFFVQWLARGKHSLSYRLRAEVPGSFSALPAKASAMYAPELKGNSDEIKLQVEDSPINPAAAAR
jgi:uncharacterized protein YfaS (alpha-2-macroglobulin family)